MLLLKIQRPCIQGQYITVFSFVRSTDSLSSCTYAEIRTRIPDTISWDYNFEPAGSTPISFTVKVPMFPLQVHFTTNQNLIYQPYWFLFEVISLKRSH